MEVRKYLIFGSFGGGVSPYISRIHTAENIGEDEPSILGTWNTPIPQMQHFLPENMALSQELLGDDGGW